MLKGEYLRLRENNSIELLYEYYTERFDEKKHKYLSPEIFFQTIVQWPPIRDVYKNVIAYYDAKFEIMKLEDLKTGYLFKIY